MTQENNTKKRKREDESRECGLIESITLDNFMCHKKLQIRLAPHINFIIGHNGSGKSAILSALTVCLGGNAAITNRATSLKSFIKSGESACEVSIKLKNKGLDSFKHELYGDSITITRRINSDGTGSYKIKSHSGKIIATKKEELTLICDLWNIQPDNPISILNQDASREFLQSSTPEERYKFFMRGTQLEQLANDYATVQRNIEKVLKAVETIQKSLPDLKAEAKAAKNRFKLMQQAMDLENIIEQLKLKFVWTEFYEMQDSKDAKLKELEIYKEKIESAKAELKNLSDQQNETVKDADGINERLNEVTKEKETLETELDEVKSRIKSKDDDLKNVVSQEKEINELVKKTRREITRLDEEIKIHEAKTMESKDLEKRRLKNQEVESLKIQREETLRNLDIITNKLSQFDESENPNSQIRSIQSLDQEVRDSNSRKQTLENEIANLVGENNRLKGANVNRMNRFGMNVPDMLKEIEKLHSNGQFKGTLPVGPIGAFISIKDPFWNNAIDSIISERFLYSFIVDNEHDNRILRSVFIKFGYGKQSQSKIFPHDIYTMKFDASFDHRSGEPDQSNLYTTVLHQLKFEKPIIMQLVINQFRVESIILVRTRMEGESIMNRSWPRNVAACYDADANKIGNRSGGNANFNMMKRGGNGLSGMSVNDYEKRIKHNLKTIEVKNNELRDVQQLILARKNELKKMKDEKQKLDHEHNELTVRSIRLRNDEAKLVEELRRMDDDVNSTEAADFLHELEQQKSNVQKEHDSIKSQYPGIFKSKQNIASEKTVMQEEANLLIDSINKLRQKYSQFQHKLEENKQQKLKLDNSFVHYQKQVVKYESSALTFQEEVDLREKKLLELREEILQVFNQNMLEREECLAQESKDIKREIIAKEEALREREAQTGSLEECGRLYQTKKELYNQAQQDYVDLQNLADQLSNALKVRMHRFYEFRTSMATRSNMAFSENLSRRNYIGQLTFQHDERKLHLKVQTGEDDELFHSQVPNDNFGGRRRREDASGSKKDNDPRGLSGGEKSFSTICLLLSLWQVVSSPIRALDEFDVFMDPVNRRISAAMMIENARADPSYQYIIITPSQAMDNIKLGPDVCITKLNDPERTWADGQQTLNFNVATE